MQEAAFDEFMKIDVRVGTVLSVDDFPKAKKPAYKLSIDFGSEIGIKKSSAQITEHYSAASLVGRQVIAVVNFPKKQIADFFSECLVLGLHDERGAVVLLGPDAAVPNGARMC